MYILKIIGAVCCLVIILLGVALADGWKIETVDSSGYVGYDNSIALDSSDNPHISYSCYSHLKYAYWTGYTWSITTVDTSLYEGDYSSIALDSSDYPHISYQDDYHHCLKYAYWNGSAWSITAVDTGGDVGYFTSIALDSSDYPHISYWDFTNGDLKYAYWTGSVWSITSVDTYGWVGPYDSIALDSSNYPHISYYDYTNEDLKYAYWNGAECSITSVDTAGDAGSGTSIALDSSDNPHISYNGNGYLKYAYWNGSAWIITCVGTAGNVGFSTSIALDSSDYPHISYWDWTNHDLKYAHWTGSEWSITSVDTTGDVSYTTSIALDSADYPHISYYDEASGNLKYAWYDLYYADVLLSSFSALYDDDAVALEWNVETTEGEQIAGFNLYRREITPNSVAEGFIASPERSAPPENKNDWTQINYSLITGENPHSYIDSNIEPNNSYEYKLEAVLADESTEILGTACCAPTPPAFAIVSLYPNPATETMTCLLSVPNAGLVELELYDLSGRMVLEERQEVSEPTDIEAVLDVSCLASGVYTLQATCGGVEASARCVVAR